MIKPIEEPICCWYRLSELSPISLLRIMSARQEVFVVEQQSIYQDADHLDELAWHLVVWSGGPGSAVAGYLRLLEPNLKYPGMAAFGRVLTAKAWRGSGLGKVIVGEAMRFCAEHFPGVPIKISAQAYLQHFYESFRFEVKGSEYLEGGIPHVEMVRG